ncbi:MAG: LysR family transcriptional regulator [Pseudomonadota bacterium]
MIKLELLQAFVTVATHGNLKEAAEKLGRTQSAVSMSLARLEEHLGGPLFETDRKRDLTPLGQRVRMHAGDLLKENHRIQEMMLDYARGNAGRLRIASVPSVAGLVLPPLLREFMAKHPRARIELTDSDSGNIRQMVERREVDLGIAGPTTDGKPLESRLLFRDRLHLVCQKGETQSEADRDPTWLDLQGQNLIANETLSDIDDPLVQELVKGSALRARNVSSLLAMVEAGLGFTVLPGLATLKMEPSLIARPMAGPHCFRNVALLTRPGGAQSPLAQAFEAFLLSNTQDVIEPFGLRQPEG